MADVQPWREPDWLQHDDEDLEALLRAELYDDDDDIPLNEMYLLDTVEDAQLTTPSEIHLGEGLRADHELYEKLSGDNHWVDFVRFVKKNRREILGRGYETPQQCYYAYNHYMESLRRNPGVAWRLPHIRTIIHPALEKLRYPAPDEQLTEEFKAYVYYALMSEESDVPNLQLVVDNSNAFHEFLEYAKHYQLWNLGWAILVETYLRMKTFKQMGDYAEGRGPYQEGHIVPTPNQAMKSKSLERLVHQSARVKKDNVEQWLSRNKERALEYLRARRHHEHDKRYNPAIPQFSIAPPAGMERIARSQMEYNVFNEEKYKDEAYETAMFAVDGENDYDYLEMLGEGREDGMYNNPGVLPKMGELYQESLLDQDVLKYEKQRKDRMERLPHAVPWPKRHHKQPDQILLTEPYGRIDGNYLVRATSKSHGPFREGEIPEVTSDQILARISTLSLAEEISNTDHTTDIEKRRLLLDMDRVVRYNRKLIAVFQDVIDHIGPETVAPPTEWDFAGVQQYLTNKKLECEKWERMAAVKAGAKEREDLFTYYGAVKQHIHNTARDIAHEARHTLEQLKQFVETVQSADKELIATWFEDAVGPSCRQYVADLKLKELQINNLMRAIEKVKVYKTLMTYKDTKAQKMFDDDIYHEIVKLNRENEGLKDSICHKERKIEVTNKTREFVKQQIQETEKSFDKFVSQTTSLEVYVSCLYRNLEAEKKNCGRVQGQSADLEKESNKNENELGSQGIKWEEPKHGDLEIIKDTKELLESTNAKLLSDLTIMDREIAEYDALVAKKNENIAKKKEDVKHTESMVKVYEKQKGAKDVFLTKIHHENSAEREKLAEQLAKKIRVKTGVLLQHFKDEYQGDACNALRGEPNHAAKLTEEYNQFMEQYQKKLSELSENVECYRELKTQSEQLQGVVQSASSEIQNWKQLANAQRKKHGELNKKCSQTHKQLKKEAAKKDELGKLLAKAEKRAAQNEKFRLHAEAAIESAKKATNEPTDAAFVQQRAKVKALSVENQKRQLKVKKAKQDMGKQAANFKNYMMSTF